MRLYRRNLATFCVVVALLTPLAVASLWVLSNVESSTAGNADVVVEILQGWNPTQVGDALQHAGVIDSSQAFQQVATSSGFAGGYVAGRYDFVANSTPREALDTLRGGTDDVVEQAQRYADAGLDLGIVYLQPPHTPDVLDELAAALAPLRD